MSILQTPRIHFKGQISWDPIVTNNYQSFYNENASQSVITPAESMNQFRQAAIESAKAGNWNPHGTHRSQFFETAVSAVDLGKGLVTTDKLCGAPATLNAMLVDLEPYGVCSSQLYFDRLNFGIDGGCRIVASRNERFTARYINFARNPGRFSAGVASVNWQTTFAKDHLIIDAHKSEALVALQHALSEPDALGLVVSFNAYRTVYFDDASLIKGDPVPVQVQKGILYRKLLAGGFQPNPARSLIVGTIGIWRQGEPRHEPGDRALLPDANAKVFVGTAHARIDRKHVTLDLSNSISETGADLQKQDLGTLQVYAVDKAKKEEQLLGSFDYAKYDRAAYEASAGIVSFPISDIHTTYAEKTDWELRSSTQGILLSESALRIIPASPNLYLDEGQTGASKFQVYKHGKPLHQVSDVSFVQTSADGSDITTTLQLKTNAEGQVTINPSTTTGKVFAYVPFAGKDLPAPDQWQGIINNTQTYTYAYVRVLGADSDIAALSPTWTNVYNNVLINWNAMAPCMDNWLDLANPVDVHAYDKIIRRLTDPAAFESYMYMPVTRDLTAGQRTLLYKFLNSTPAHLAEAGEAAAPVLAAAVQSEDEKAVPADFAKISRSLRNPDSH
ncbi:hypothetical protein [Undibacterium sp. TS12]|uniref:hypothetical protein n=1 Tax=Undibacterium sp. TS12 TaxID=2908202 RepID=UPI001F4CF02A|nr:hypothetical protein [Undibacterium sp. TS12]MCH8620512.1 hypothetical protein [Undibacterium sp. TS12]